MFNKENLWDCRSELISRLAVIPLTHCNLKYRSQLNKICDGDRRRDTQLSL